MENQTKTRTRRSDQRDMILAEVTSRCDHPTAETVYNTLRLHAPNLSLGTVYRNLNYLADRGQIRRVPVPGCPDHFDFRTEPHCHFRCKVCGTVSDIPLPADLEKSAQELSDAGYQVDDYQLFFSGVCPQCAATQ